MDEPDAGFGDELDHEAVDPEDEAAPLEDVGEPLVWVPLEGG
jgi:hypothetical protein